MVLDRKKIEDELLSPSKRPEIEGAKAQQDWIKFHTDTNLDIARFGHGRDVRFKFDPRLIHVFDKETELNLF